MARKFFFVIALTIVTALAAGCFNRQSSQRLFAIDDIPWGSSITQVEAKYGSALRPPTREKRANFHLPGYKLAYVMYDYMPNTIPYEVYFITNRQDQLEMVIMMTASRFPLTGEMQYLDKTLTSRYGEPQKGSLPGGAAEYEVNQLVWSPQGSRVSLVELIRKQEEGGHGGHAEAAPAAEAESGHGEAAHGEEAHGESHMAAESAHSGPTPEELSEMRLKRDKDFSLSVIFERS